MSGIENILFVSFIIGFYLTKYIALFYICNIVIVFLSYTWELVKTGAHHFYKVSKFSFSEIKIFGFVLTNYLSFVDALISIALGIVYFTIALCMLFATVVMAIPFNYLLRLKA